MLHGGREFKRRHLKQLDGLLQTRRERHLLAQAKFLHGVAQSSLLKGQPQERRLILLLYAKIVPTPFTGAKAPRERGMLSQYYKPGGKNCSGSLFGLVLLIDIQPVVEGFQTDPERLGGQSFVARMVG